MGKYDNLLSNGVLNVMAARKCLPERRDLFCLHIVLFTGLREIFPPVTMKSSCCGPRAAVDSSCSCEPRLAQLRQYIGESILKLGGAGSLSLNLN